MPGLRIPGSYFAVDHFRKYKEHVLYFLTHAHSDHFAGLYDGWDYGTIFCSELTRRYLLTRFKISSDRVIVLETGIASSVCIPGGRFYTSVTPIDANHCPGAVMFLFEGSAVPGGTVLYTGDFRYDAEKMMPYFKDKEIDTVYVDNTYVAKKHGRGKIFPPKHVVGQQIIRFIDTFVQKAAEETEKDFIELFGGRQKDREHLMAVMIATHLVGKEELLASIGSRFDIRIRVTKKKMKILQMGFGGSTKEEVELRFVVNEEITEKDKVREEKAGLLIHTISPKTLTKQKVSELNKDHPTVGIALFGSCFNSSGHWKKDKRGELVYFPYSLHSCETEVAEFITAIQPNKVKAASRTSLEDNMHLQRLFSSVKTWGAKDEEQNSLMPSSPLPLPSPPPPPILAGMRLKRKTSSKKHKYAVRKRKKKPNHLNVRVAETTVERTNICSVFLRRNIRKGKRNVSANICSGIPKKRKRKYFIYWETYDWNRGK